MANGKVYLVGAGPGDPGLFTLRGREVLEQAEVVIYDYLANPELLQYAPPGAEMIYVGKKGGDHTLRQDRISALLVEKGRTQVVVRLKGGDPFVFGRGAEEAQELVAAGIPFEVVPGVTAAVAVPAYAGIPLSHRDYTASMAFVTGHEREDQGHSKIAWDRLAVGLGTLVFFMGIKNLPEICRKLLEHGASPGTPVAVIRWGTRPEQQTVVGVLEDIVVKVRQAELKPPAVIVVGGVVRLREQLNWFESRPLFGRRILVTRARQQASEFKTLLAASGAHCIEFPTIQIVPPASWEPLDRAIAQLSSYQWLVFTSVNGVRFFMERLWAAGSDVRQLQGIRLAAIGPKTAEALQQCGLRVDVVPGEYRAEALLEEIGAGDLAGQRFLIPRALAARDILPVTLREQGAQVDLVTAYETVLPAAPSAEILDLLEQGKIDCLTFTSSSTVENFVSLFDKGCLPSSLRSVAVACIGPITAQTAEKHGLKVAIMPADYTISGLARAVCSYFG